MATENELNDGLILLYHAVFHIVPKEIDAVLSNNTPAEIERQLVWLKGNYDIMDIDNWLSLNDRHGKIAITFDDGYSSALRETVPILEGLNMAATFFVNGSMLDGDVFWRDQIRFLIKLRLEEQFIRSLPRDCLELAHLRADQLFETSKSPRVNSLRMAALIDGFLSDLGIEVSNHCARRMELPDSAHAVFGSHSYGHPNFASLSADEARADIRRNRNTLQQLPLSHARLTNVFALPFGTPDSYTEQTLDILAEEGYSQVLLAASNYEAVRQPAAQQVQLASRLAAPSSLAELQIKLASA